MNTLLGLMQHGVYAFWLCMLLHLIADFTLQGCLASLKQKRWWDAQLEKHNMTDKAEFYKHDYIAGLIVHSMMWSLVTFLPLMLVVSPGKFTSIVVMNMLWHAYIDNEKANALSVNLITDQLSHLLQVMCTVGFVYAAVI